MAYQDITLQCQDCSQSFVFSVDDQEYHAQKGYTNQPKRCPSCRQERRISRGGGGGGGGGGGFGYGGRGGPREMFAITCDECGREAEVPFRPRGDRPVYCSDCFRSSGGNATG